MRLLPPKEMSIQSVILSSYAWEDIANGQGLVDYGKRKRVGAGYRRGGAGRGGERGSRSAADGGTGTLVAQYGGRVKRVTLEVRDEAAAKAAVQFAVDTFGRLDVLVNNAGYGQFAPFEQMSAED